MKPNYEFRVGLFTLVAIVILMYGWSWLKGLSLFHPSQRFIVRFHDVAGLSNKATVNINGVRVGVVDSIDLISKGQVFVRVHITAEKVVVPKGSTVTIQTLGLVGAKYLEITLPEEYPGAAMAEPIAPDEIVVGQDPVRTELIINDVVKKVYRLFGQIHTEKAGKRLNTLIADSSDAARALKDVSKKLDDNMDRVLGAADSLGDASKKIGSLADKAQGIPANAAEFLNSGTAAFKGVSKSTGKLNRLMDNPNFSGDLKATAETARKTAETIAKAMHQLNETLNDSSVRQDVLEMLKRLEASTGSIAASMRTVNKLAEDGTLRSDIKQVVRQAREVMRKADDLVGRPDFKETVTKTMDRVRKAADDVDVASRQLQQILNKRAPLLHMMFGHPGRVSEAEANQKTGEQNQR